MDVRETEEEPFNVGVTFIQGFYNQLHKDPEGITRFFGANSYFTHTDKDFEIPCRGQEEIRAKISSLDLENVRTDVKTVDCQASINGSVLVVVHGLLFQEKQTRRFSQTFLLARTSQKTQKSFYVANSSFRYLAEEDSEEVEVIEQDEEEYEEQAQYEEEPDVADNEPVQDEPEQERELEQDTQEAEEAEESKEVVQEEEEQEQPEPEPAANEPQEEEEENEWGKPSGGGWGSSPQEEAVEPIVEEHHHQPTPPSPPPAVKEIVYDHPPSNWAERAARAKATRVNPQVVSAPNPNSKPAAQQHQQPREPKRAPKKPVPPGASIFVGKLPRDITEEELRGVFSNYGSVLYIQVLSEKNVAFVDFDSADAVRKIDSVKGTINIRGVLPIIQEKKDKENTQPTKKNNDSPARPKVQKNEVNGWTSVAKPTKEVTKPAPAENKKAQNEAPAAAAPPAKTETKPTPPARGRGQGRGRGRGRGSDWIQG